MKRRLRLKFNALLLLGVFCSASAGFAALTPTEWSHRQTVNVATAGLHRLVVPAATFDVAQPGLSDLRLVDANGRETPFLLDRDPGQRAPSPERLRPKSVSITSTDDTTQIVIETGTTEKIATLDLETSAPFFLKAAHVEISDNGTSWESLGAAAPLFRQFGAELLQLPLNQRTAAFVRVTVDDSRSRPIAFTGVRVVPVTSRFTPAPLTEVGVTIARREEFAGETVLTLELEGRQVPLAEISLDVTDPLFMRRVTFSVRDVQDPVSSERTVAAGSIYRVAIEGAQPRAQLTVPIDFLPPTRELLVHIHNGDSPPLTIDRMRARQQTINLFFIAPAAGTYSLLTGNAGVGMPRYDFAAFAGDLRTAKATVLTASAIDAMPDYRPRESLAAASLPDVPLTGAPLDASAWNGRAAIRLARAGVQELELDLPTLAQSRDDYADLRVLHGGNQIPYVLERPALARALTLSAASSPDPKRPGVSIWQLHLPHAGLPLRRLVLTSSTPLFQRQFRIYEKRSASDGRTWENTLVNSAWSRTPEPGISETKLFELPERLVTDRLWIETDNGDNPAIALGSVQAIYPVVRLIFKTAETEDFTLAYANPSASAPRYDLNLVAVKLLTTHRNVAGLNTESTAAKKSRTLFAGMNGGYLFWAALGLVVMVLLGVVAKLLPKPPTGK